MPIRKIVASHSPYNEIPKVLSTPARKFADDFADPKTLKLFKDMIKTMYARDGIGLAAPQIDLPLQIITIATKDEELVLLNPKIVWRSRKTNSMEEGCLSLPGYFEEIERAEKVKVKGIDKHGKKIIIKASGMLARVLQHEVDHLQGILIKNRADEQKQKR